jgi:glycosyltransferase involved in cell wall biosynthesis
MRNNVICMLVTNSLKKDPRVQREAQAACNAGFQVTVVGLEDNFYDNKFVKSMPYNVDIIILGRMFLTTTNIFLRLFRMIFRFWSFVFKTASYKPCIIHCNDLNTLLQGWIASLVCGAKLIYDSHEVNTPIGQTRLTLREKGDSFKERFLIYKAVKVLSVSNAAAKLIGDYYKIAPVVVTNCSYRVPIDYNKKKDDEFFNVLYHGIISANRGYEEFVLSGKSVPQNVRLILRGYGPLEIALRKLTSENDLDNKVIFAPPVDIKDLIPKASESQVGVVFTKPVNPNFKYTVGNKVFEYINAGIPVILSDVPEHQYLINKFGFGLIVDDVSSEKIAAAICELVNDKEKYDRMRKNAIDASKIMCWENESKKLINIYSECAETA